MTAHLFNPPNSRNWCARASSIERRDDRGAPHATALWPNRNWMCQPKKDFPTGDQKCMNSGCSFCSSSALRRPFRALASGHPFQSQDRVNFVNFVKNSDSAKAICGGESGKRRGNALGSSPTATASRASIAIDHASLRQSMPLRRASKLR